MINTLIVDDSALVRSILRDFLESSGKFKVVGEAENGREGVEKAHALNPDLVTMDIEMPVMNGLDAIAEIRKALALPVVVISTHDTAKTAYEATVRGAMEFYAKDNFTTGMDAGKRERILATLIHLAALKGRLPPPLATVFSNAAPPVQPKPLAAGKKNAVVIASSTGGPKALLAICGALPKDFPVPLLLVQHNTSGFDRGFVQWLNDYTPLEVVLAGEAEHPVAGKIYMAPTDRHLVVGVDGALCFDNGAPVNNQKPAADMLFKSAAKYYGESLVSLVLTGMGADGAAGTRAVKEAGGITLAQDEESSMIYGMPRAAKETGCVDMVIALGNIPQRLLLLTRG
jgi:two-component system chemotaxis response regulator CheB